MARRVGWSGSSPRFRGVRTAAVGVAAALSVLTAGCGDDDEDDFGKDVQGLYAIETWTRNEAGCDVEGPDVAATESDKKLGVRRDKFIVWFVVAATCRDSDDCASKTSASIFSGLTGAALLERKVSNGYTTEGTVAWSSNATGCTGKLVDSRLEKLGGGRVSFKQELYSFTDVPFDTKDDQGEPDCSADNLRKVAHEHGCEKLDVVTAVREGDIPPAPN